MYYMTDATKRRAEIAAVATALVLAIVLALVVVSCQRSGRGSADAGTTEPSTTEVTPTTPTSEPVATPATDSPGGEPSPTADGGGTDGDGDAGGGNDGASDGGGGTDGDDGDEPEPAEEEIVPSPKDCLSYDPENITVESLGVDEWVLADDDSNLIKFDTNADANQTKAVARNHTKLCFIGRDNDRVMRHKYITTYWEGTSGLPLGESPALDCGPSYDPASIEFHDAGSKGWRLRADGELMPVYFDTLGDAARGREVALTRTKLCFVGRGNDRPEPYRYIHEFWQY